MEGKQMMTTETIQFQDDTRLRRNDDVIATQFDGETVMMDAELESYFGMAKVGTRIWSEIESETSYGELIGLLLRVAGGSVSEAKCREETEKFLADLYEHRFLLVNGSLKSEPA